MLELYMILIVNIVLNCMTDLQELHHLLVQTIIDFYKDKKLPEGAYAIDFNFDDLPSSIAFGKWHASSDSWCSLENSKLEVIETSI